MSSDAFWKNFHVIWQRMLWERYPKAPFLHMSELVAHEDLFTRINGWTDEKIPALVINGAVQLLQSFDKKSFRTFVYSIDVSAHSRLMSEGYQIGEPPTICAHSCLKASFDWYVDNHKLEAFHVFYDRGEPFFGSFRKEWESHQNQRSKIVSGDIWGLIANVQDVNMRWTPPVQAADLIAWARSRELSTREQPYRYLADITRAVIPTSFYKLDEAAMRRKYSKRTG